jgi:hypothetical protein
MQLLFRYKRRTEYLSIATHTLFNNRKKEYTNETTMHMLLISHKTKKKLQCKLRIYDRTFAKLSMYCKAKHLCIVHRNGSKREKNVVIMSCNIVPHMLHTWTK